MSTPTTPAPASTTGAAPEAPETSRWHKAFRQIVQGTPLVSLLAVVLSVVAGSILIVATNPGVQQASDVGSWFSAVGRAIGGAYSALFQGAIYDFRRPDFFSGIRPFTQTLVFATPLIAAGLGVALAFRVGLFNIGGRGQMLIGAAFGGYAGFQWNLPPILHIIVAVGMAILGGALWGGIAGFIKARTGAHEVILTIMLNYIALYLLGYLLTTPLLQAPGTINPKTPPMASTAILPPLFDGYRLHWGFVLVIAATFFAWWLIERSSIGFRFRAVGLNPAAARTAGINVDRVYFYAMLIAGGYSGLAVSTQILGTTTTGFGDGVDSGFGFDAITVALLGRSTPWGTFAAGILFGAFKAGGYTMQASQQIPVDIVLVVQSLIVLFLAAPPLVRTIFRLPAPGQAPRRAKEKKAVAA